MPETVDEWQRGGRYTTFREHRVFFRDSGATGRPLLFLIHGFPTSSWDWAPVWSALSTRFRLVAPDLLGFGFSAKPKGHDYRIAEQADLCEAVMRELSLGEMHVLAHDYGDTVAQELLARQNEGVGVGTWRSLCLLNGGLFPETHHPRPIQRLLASPLGFLASGLTSKRVFDRSFSRVFGAETKPNATELDAFWRLVAHDDGQRNFHRLIRYMNERRAHRARWVGALLQSVVPVALINGSADPVSGAHMVARYREVVRSDDRIVALSGIGHYPQVEAPERVVGELLSFVDSLTTT